MIFYETPMGKQFFNEQIPKLISILEKLVETNTLKNVHNVAAVSLPEHYLEDLYYGNLEIGTYSRENYSNEATRKVIEAQDRLKEQLTSEQWEMFNQYCILVNNRDSDECFRMFQHGFQTAIRLIMAGMQPVCEDPT